MIPDAERGRAGIAALLVNCPYQLDFNVSAAHSTGAALSRYRRAIAAETDAQLVQKLCMQIVSERVKADDEMLAVADVNGGGERSAEHERET